MANPERSHGLGLAPTLGGYQRTWLAGDALAGLTLAAVAVPEQMATARLAGMPEVFGLYALVAGSVLFALVGCHRSMSIGADSTIASVIAVGVASVAAVGSPAYTALVTFLALIIGGLLIVVGLLRLGWIAEFLSVPVVTGILAGIGVEIVVRQLPAVLGVAGGGTTTVGRIAKVVGQLDHVNGWTVAIAAGVVVIVVVSEQLDHRIPGALLGLILSIVVVAVFPLESHGVRVIGSIRGGLPHFGVPAVRAAQVRRLGGTALTVAFLCVVQAAATVRAGTQRPGEGDDFNRDLIGVGLGNVAAGLGSAFPVNASPPRTALIEATGGRTQLTGLIGAAAVGVVALFMTGLLRDLPQATLGAVLIFIAIRLVRVRELRDVLDFDRFEFALAVVTMLVVAVIGIEQGVVVAIVLALAQRTRLAARPPDALLGREPGTGHWIRTNVGAPTEHVPGVMVYLLDAPLWFGNADYVRQRIRDVLDEASEPVSVFVLDADGISDIDFTGAQALRDIATDLDGRGIKVGIARSSPVVHHDLKRSGLLAKIRPDRLFESVEEAVEALTRQS